MATKKNIQKEIIQAYTNYKLTHNKTYGSVYQICKEIGIEEKEFYTYFPSIGSIEKRIMMELFDSSIKTLENSEDYKNYAPKEKLLGFYFTFFETLTLNRSLVLSLYQEQTSKAKQLVFLNELKKPFDEYISNLEVEVSTIDLEKLRSIQEKGFLLGTWTQFLLIFNFWVNDTSPSFEKTDIFIEKSVRTIFNLVGSNALTDFLDLGKFLWKEKIQST